METNGQMDERISPSLRFCPFLNIPDSSKQKNLECFYTRTIKAVYSTSLAEKGFKGLLKVSWMYFSFQTQAIHVQTCIRWRPGKAYV